METETEKKKNRGRFIDLKLLPPDIITEILSRLPADSVVGCRRICKQWRSLIDDPSFVNTHTRQLISSSSSSSSSYNPEKFGAMERLPNDMVMCLCGKICMHTIPRTEKNLNRIFVACPKGKRGCNFWEWLDEVRICRCKKGYCKLLTSHTEVNDNRRFYCCPLSKKGYSKGCGLWEWADPLSQHQVETSSKGKEVKEETGSFEKPKAKKKVNVEELRSWLTMKGEVTNEVGASLLAKLKDIDIHG